MKAQSLSIVAPHKSKSFIDMYIQELAKNGQFQYKLPYGAMLYMYDDISVTYFNYCIQDNHNENDVRSLIFHEDGHLSTSWYGSNYGRIV